VFRPHCRPCRPGSEPTRARVPVLATAPGRSGAWGPPVALALTLSILTGGASAAPAGAASDQQVSAKLETLRSRMSQLRAELDATRGQRDNVRKDVQGVEQDIAALASRLAALDRKLEQAQQRLATLEAERHGLLDQVSGQRQVLARQLRAAYILSRQDYAKLLLNQEDPAALGRVVTYYQYFSRARTQQIARLDALLRRLQDLQQATQAEADHIRALRLEEQTRQDELAERRRTREALLAKLSEEIETKDETLGRMKTDERALEQVLKTLRQLLAEIPKQEHREPFGRLRGKLHWPVDGKLLNDFGAPRDGGKLKSQGVLLGAQEGAPVRAVYYGRVAFADWLRGFGLLLIIDHGDGYMSLYGHNESLRSRTGDWVETGEVVASVGSSGGRPRPGLYFEIRYKGAPTDPTRWCGTKSASQ